MNKAFLFDMDGVLINSELSWHLHGKDFVNNLFGEKVLAQMGSVMGLSIEDEYEKAKKYGFTLEKEEFYKRYDKQAGTIYQKSVITKGLRDLILYLEKNEYRLGMVTASRQNWINMVLPRLPLCEKFSLVLSLNERKDLQRKPHPDGYLEAMKIVGAQPKTTIILEDSNIGIQAGKASGAITIGFKQHLVPGYKQEGADFYADTLEDVIALVKKAR